MNRAFILLLDSFGIGALPDAEKFGDKGTNTLLHIAERCAAGQSDLPGKRQGALRLPNLSRLGLNAAAKIATGQNVPGLDDVNPSGIYGAAASISKGKDTTSGHWEIMGAPVLFDWGFFPNKQPCFPQELIDNFVKESGIPGILGNKHASGTVIINEYGDEHVKTGKPIVYTSADSVFQIACHEEFHGGLDRLYELCKIAREILAPYNIGRVIARPFIGSNGQYERTEHRHDYSLPPHMPTLLDNMVAAGKTTIGIGKIPDIFAHRGISKEVEAHGMDELFEKTLQEVQGAPTNSLTFTNFVDLDMKFGHRRDVAGYANALEEFDNTLPQLEKSLQDNDIAIITADHGCDPTHIGSDHTREYIPILVFGPNIKSRSIGCRKTFADIGQSLAHYFSLAKLEHGENFL
ncbi:MAG: phosphopentomutase [Gammaproteobacteria bacterium]